MERVKYVIVCLRTVIHLFVSQVPGILHILTKYQ